MPIHAPGPELLEFLASYDSPVVDLALALRCLVREQAPDAAETICRGYVLSLGYTFTGRFQEAFCYIAVMKLYVNLGFLRGTELPDPHQLLEGTGKAARHIHVKSAEDLERLPLRRLLDDAIDRAIREVPRGLRAGR